MINCFKQKLMEKALGERELLMARCNNELSEVIKTHLTTLRPYEVYLVLLKLSQDIYDYWRRSLTEGE